MTVLGCTYVRGRTNGATIESASLARVPGQFATPFLSCPVRAASSQRVQLTVGTMITATAGAVVFYYDPDHANGDAGQAASGVLYSWYTDANNLVELVYNKASTRLELTRKAAGTGTTLNLTHTFTAGAATAVLIAWSASALYIAANGGAIATAADANIPTLPATCDIGSRAGASSFDAAYGAVAFLSGVPTLTHWQALAALAALRPPCFGEASGPLMTGLWYGAHARVWTLVTGATVIDLNDAAAGLILERVGGAGVGPVQHRVTETPLRDGSAYIDSRLQPRTLLAELWIRADTMELYYALRRTVISAINPRGGSQGLVCFAPTTQVYEIDALLTAGAGFEGTDGPLQQEAALAFLCPDPTWRVAVVAATEIDVLPAGWTIPWTIPWSFTESGSAVAVANDGDIDTWPTFEVTAGAAGCEGITFANLTTGKLFKLDGMALVPGESLTVNMDDRTATKGDGTNVFGFLTEGSQMWPFVPGANEVQISLDSGTVTTKETHSTRLVGV